MATDYAALAEQLNQAISNNSADKAEVVNNVLGTRSFDDRQKIVEEYKKAANKNLSDSFPTGFFSSPYNKLAFRLCLTRWENAAYWIIDGIKWFFCTDERALAGLLISYSKEEIEQLNETYKDLFDRRKPQDDIEGDTSSDFKTLLVALLKKDPQDKPMSQIEYDSDATYLYKETVGKVGTNEAKVSEILCGAKREFLIKVLDQFPNMGDNGQEFDKIVDDETSGDYKMGLKMLLSWIRDPHKFYAQELHHAMFGGWFGSVNHAMLRDYLVDRSEIDMDKISEAYQNEYSELLTDDIERKTAGPYRDLLVGLTKLQAKTTQDSGE